MPDRDDFPISDLYTVMGAISDTDEVCRPIEMWVTVVVQNINYVFEFKLLLSIYLGSIDSFFFSVFTLPSSLNRLNQVVSFSTLTNG
jgi:hypothetical protein